MCPLNPYLLSNKAKPCKVIASWLFPPCFLTLSRGMDLHLLFRGQLAEFRPGEL